MYPDRLHTQAVSSELMGQPSVYCSCPCIIWDTLRLTHLDAEGTNDIVSKGLLVGDGNLKGPKFFTSKIRPVLFALDFVPLSQVGHHDDGGRSFLPHQSPKVHIGLGQWTYRQWVIHTSNSIVSLRLLVIEKIMHSFVRIQGTGCRRQ